MDYSKLQNGSDIRGIAIEGVPGEDVNIDARVTNDIAFGFLAFLEAKTGKDAKDLRITIGRDPRLSGEALAKELVRGLSAGGASVLNYGLCSTPAMFMSTLFPEIDADGAVMITASHLPFNRNGFKFFTKDGGLDKKDIKMILATAEEHRAGAPADLPERGDAAAPSDDALDLMTLYAAHLRKLIRDGLGVPEDADDPKPLSDLKCAVDAGNGAGGFYAERVLAPLGCDISASRYLEPDGHFPNHQPNPENEEAMKAVIAATTENGCDLGIIFDTDVDRSSAVDEHGREINRNGIVAMAAALIADRCPGTTVVTDSITSNELHDFIEKDLGLKHYRFKRGYRNVINKSVELNRDGTDSELAIETSGHAAFRSNHFLDDGAYLATLIVIRAAKLKAEGKGVSSVIASLKEPAESVEIRMPLKAEDWQQAGDDVLGHVEAYFREHPEVASGGGTLSFEIVEPNYEGIRLSVSGSVSGWFLLRKSLHDPLMPLNVESEEAGGTDVVRGILRDLLADEPALDSSAL